MLDARGGVTETRIVTTRERFATALAPYGPACILLEASTESEWVATHLESLGHAVIVADPNFAPMYATRSRRVKTDRRDARTLADALRLGAYRPAHRTTPARRHVRAELSPCAGAGARRTRFINVAKALVRRDGLRVRSSTAEHAAERISELPLAAALAAELAPLLAVLTPLNAQIATADARMARLSQTIRPSPCWRPPPPSARSPRVRSSPLGMTSPALRPPISLRPTSAWCPANAARGETPGGAHHQAGNRRARMLLVEAAWRIVRSRTVETAALRAWALRIALRRGQRIAVVALARRLAGILYAMWRDGRCLRCNPLAESRDDRLTRPHPAGDRDD